jgi:Xaa-Pro aminopeptidase
VPDEPYPTFSDAELERRRRLLAQVIADVDVECVIAYGAGRNAEAYWLCNWPGTRESFLVWPRSGEPVLLVQLFNHVPNARRMTTGAEVRWGGPGNAATLAAVLRERDCVRRAGVAGGLPWRVADELRAQLPGLELVDVTSRLRELHLVKSDEEMERMRIACRLTDRAMEALEHEARPGMRESELEAVVECAYGREGRHGIHFMATTPMRAPQIGIPSQIQSQRRIEQGDVLITEISAEYWGYSGQIHRAYAIAADPTDEYRRLHDVAVETFERVCGVLRDGATSEDVLDAAEVVHERGLTIYDDLLHGTSQLPPILKTRRTTHTPVKTFTFRENMVVVVQPNVIREDERAGLQVGETVRISKTGVERLHAYPMRFVRCA